MTRLSVCGRGGGREGGVCWGVVGGREECAAAGPVTTGHMHTHTNANNEAEEIQVKKSQSLDSYKK